MLSALMPTLKAEFALSNETIGWVIAAFSLTYAMGSPLMGLLIDRLGLRTGAAAVVAFWSLAGMSTGFVTSLTGLAVSRALLGLGESGGIPATSKGSATYLEPKDRALGAAMTQVGLTLGMVTAPLMTEAFAARYGWRGAFIVAGAARPPCRGAPRPPYADSDRGQYDGYDNL
jgi:ACS family hexuronate transporter-like MFS transporter